MKKYLSIILIISALQAHAQYEISGYALGGISNLLYSSASVEKSVGFGGGAGANYSYFIEPQWSVSAGAEIAVFSGAATVVGTMGSRQMNAPSPFPPAEYVGSTFTFVSRYIDYEETQRATYLNIPLTVHFIPLADEDIGFYASAGAKFGIPLAGGYTATATSRYTAGEFLDHGTFEDMPSYGFYTLANPPKIEGDLKLGVNISFALEAGARFALDAKITLYTGLYIDYGLLNVAPKDNAIVQYNKNPNAFVYNSLLATNYINNVSLMSFGIKVRIGFWQE